MFSTPEYLRALADEYERRPPRTPDTSRFGILLRIEQPNSTTGTPMLIHLGDFYSETTALNTAEILDAVEGITARFFTDGARRSLWFHPHDENLKPECIAPDLDSRTACERSLRTPREDGRYQCHLVASQNENTSQTQQNGTYSTIADKPSR